MLGGDVQIDVADLMVDRRARHFWDGGKRLGRYYASSMGDDRGDVFFFYPPDAAWGDRPIAAGAPVVFEAAKLEAALKPYLT
jgi:hypothetical protein